MSPERDMPESAPLPEQHQPTARSHPRHQFQRLTAWCRRQWQIGVNLLFPLTCPTCIEDISAAREHFCTDCTAAFVRNATAACARCGMPTSAYNAEGCSECRTKRLKFQAVFRLGVYEGELRDAVLQAKTLSGERIGRGLGALLAEQQRESLLAANFNLATPVPTHWGRRFFRHTSAAENIGRCLSESLHIPFADDLLSCQRVIQHQSSLPLKDRRRNVRGAFRISWGYDIRDASILLVDDVMTSGATAQEIAGVLLAAGASSVAIAVAARALGPDW